ncbi:MAG TPA: ribokinase, partial [Armatimonadota bacterium]|nr:ribokinase [Armatimonadota bacterium]
MRIGVVGNINMDFVLRGQRLPREGETLVADGLHVFGGGKAANQAVAARRLGADVSIVGCLGTDDLGDRALALLDEAGVDTAFVVRTQRCHTGTALVFVDRSGRNSIVTALGANDDPEGTRGAVEGATKLLGSVDVVLMQLGLPVSTVDQGIRLCQEHGVPVYLDPTPIRRSLPELWCGVALIAPNETESQILLGGSRTDGPEEARTAAARLRDAGVGVAVVKLGAAGCVVAADGWTAHVPGVKVDVVDTTAAGDAFMAGLAVARGEGADWVEAARFANCAGALAATKLGAQPSLPYRPEVDALYRSGDAGVRHCAPTLG